MNTDTGDYRSEDADDWNEWIEKQNSDDLVRVEATEEQMKKLSDEIKKLRKMEEDKK